MDISIFEQSAQTDETQTNQTSQNDELTIEELESEDGEYSIMAART